MKEHWQKAKEWYAALEARERRMVNVGGVVLAIAIFYFGIWSPFLGRVDAMRTRIASEQKTLVWMQEADLRIKKLGGATTNNQQALTPVALLAVLQDEINQAGLKDSLKDMKQAANDAIQLQFKNVSFDKLVSLLIDVLKNNRVTIAQFSAAEEKTPGRVNAEVTFNIGA